MNPTPRLRFVERSIIEHQSPDGTVTVARKVRILQQWFAYDIEYPMTKGEWRDIPCEQE